MKQYKKFEEEFNYSQQVYFIKEQILMAQNEIKKYNGKTEFVKGKQGHKNDNVQTPVHIAKKIIDIFYVELYRNFHNSELKVLDPFKGLGAFYNNFPIHTNNLWCEIKEGKDFFDFHEKVDWIISNPPYSIFDKVLDHSFEIADNVVYLVPLSKVVSSMGRIRKIAKYGGVPFIWIIGASKCGFPFGFPACAIHFQRGYKGETEIKIDK